MVRKETDIKMVVSGLMPANIHGQCKNALLHWWSVDRGPFDWQSVGEVPPYIGGQYRTLLC